MAQRNSRRKSTLIGKITVGNFLAFFVGVGVTTVLVQSGVIARFLPGQRIATIPDTPSPELTPSLNTPAVSPSPVPSTSVSSVPSPARKSGSQSPSASSTTVQTTTEKGVRFDLQGCRLQPGTVVCSFLVTAQDKDKYLSVLVGTAIVDRYDRRYLMREADFAGSGSHTVEEFVRGTTLGLDVTFEGIPQSVNQLASVDIVAASWWEGDQAFSVLFEDVAVSSQ